MGMSDYDAIVIGTGPNGLVCALTLVRAGWRVLVLERAPEVGGGMRTAEVARPGFRHDLYSSNLGRFSLSPLYQEMQAEFEALGVRFLTSEFPFASVFPGDKALCAYKDTQRLELELSRSAPGDVEGWRKLVAFYQRIAPKFLPLLRVTMPSSQMAQQVLRVMANPPDALRLLRILLQTPRQFVDGAFASPEMKGLIAPWAFHSDFGPDIRGGAVVPFFFAFNSQQQGLWIAEGGAGRVSDAMRTLIEKHGGTVVTGAEVSKIVVRNGAAVGVETSNGHSHSARAVIGNLSPHSMFGRLISDDELPAGFQRRVQCFRYGIGTFIVYLALSRPLQWSAGDQLALFNTVHVGGYVDSLAASYRQAMQGHLPGRPLLIINQLSATDPSRAPDGQCVARIHARPFPARILGDAAGRIAARDWDAAKDAVADRLIDQLAEYAPNVRTDLLARHVRSPLDLERDNPNWVGGDCNSGSNHLDQNYFRRPFPGWTRYRMPIRQLYMIGSSTWPSGGTHGMSGYLLARDLIEGTG
jgi:phytoene dehydrogenase-like protein